MVAVLLYSSTSNLEQKVKSLKEEIQSDIVDNLDIYFLIEHFNLNVKFWIQILKACLKAKVIISDFQYKRW